MFKKGYKQTEEQKRKIGLANSKTLKERGIKPPLRTGCTPWNKGREWKEKRGKNNPNWMGGTSTLSRQIMNLWEYRQWRSDVFTRDDFTCQECGSSKSGTLQAHHLKAKCEIIKEHNIKTAEDAKKCEELWNINNGVTLCKGCHKKTDSYPKTLNNPVN